MDSSRRVKAKHLRALRDKTRRKLDLFSDPVLETVEYRSTLDQRPDGFPTNTRYGPRTGGPSHLGEVDNDDEGPDESSSTERAALRLVDGRMERDPQQRACERIDQAFRSIWAEIDAAEHAWDVILHASDSIRDREAQSTLGTCQACLRDDVPNVGEDRVRSGYCPACYRAWLRTDDSGHGRQDRAAFEIDRRRLRVVGYDVSDIDGLQARGTLPSPRHARPEPDEAV